MHYNSTLWKPLSCKSSETRAARRLKRRILGNQKISRCAQMSHNVSFFNGWMGTLKRIETLKKSKCSDDGEVYLHTEDMICVVRLTSIDFVVYIANWRESSRWRHTVEIQKGTIAKRRSKRRTIPFYLNNFAARLLKIHVWMVNSCLG